MNAQIQIDSIKDGAEKQKILNRLKRAQGQLAAVIKTLEEDKSCREVMQQLSAVSKAVDRAGFLVISSSLKECFVSGDAGSPERAKEIEKMFLSLA